MNDPATDRLAEWQQITDAATSGPWVVGSRDHVQGASHCGCRPDYGPLIWKGKANINGTRMLTHVHRRSEPAEAWEDDTSVYCTPPTGEEVVALSTSEYVRISREDAEFIATARTAMPALLNAVEAVLKLHRLNRENDGACQGWTAQGYGYLDVWCVECSEQSGLEYGTAWPCPTVTAIRDALGGAA